MIIVRLQGGLGNQMFQYAFGKNLAAMKGVDFKLDISHLQARYKSKKKVFRTFDLDIFNIEYKIATNFEILKFAIPRVNNKYLFHVLDKIYKRKNVFVETRPYLFDKGVFANPGEAYYIGYWQSFKYFESISDQIKKNFLIKYPPLNVSTELYKKIMNSNSICLNFRRTDYIGDKTLGTLIGEDGNKYYKNAIENILDKVSNPTFFIFSDDIEWCKANIKLSSETIFVDYRHAGPKYSNYLKLMSACKNFVIPNSSFAWWAAWLSENINKIIIVPNQWTTNIRLNESDLVPETWEKINL